MNTYEIVNSASAPEPRCSTVSCATEAPDGFDFVPTVLPIVGVGATKPVGIALAFANAETEICGEDRFVLHVVAADGRALIGLGTFTEDDVVAVWRDSALKSGLPRMILREDGSLGTVSNQLGRVALGKTRQRRRHGLLNGRRPRFLVRRKTARLPARPLIHRNENEIIARS